MQLDLELSRLAGKLRHPELGGVGEVEPEGLPGFVAVDGILGGGHQLAVAQHDHDLFHPAVGDLLAVHEACKIQQDAAAALGTLLGVVVEGMEPGLVDHLDVQRLFRKAPHMAGDGQPLVLAKLNFRDIVLIALHFVILLLTFIYSPCAASQPSVTCENISGYWAFSASKTCR